MDWRSLTGLVLGIGGIRRDDGRDLSRFFLAFSQLCQQYSIC